MFLMVLLASNVLSVESTLLCLLKKSTRFGLFVSFLLLSFVLLSYSKDEFGFVGIKMKMGGFGILGL